tara:strand:+ start:4633 stop:5037 length:405 start_codon:yes stop_codon:yes gene_type:complete
MSKITVFVNGCFDILHRGHIELFKYASTCGNRLVVGIDSDEKVKKDKGKSRPHNCLKDRLEILKAIRYIDEVVSFDSHSELENLIKSYAPDILIVGSDWRGKEVIGEHYAKELKFFERIDGYSTTQILENSPNR